MSLYARAIYEIAMNEIGVKEVSVNYAPRIVEYQKATWLQPGPWPWCAAFTSWCLREALKKPGVEDEFRRARVIPWNVSADSWRCKSAKAFDWPEWGRESNCRLLDPNRELARRGDFVVFDFSHIGIVALDQLDKRDNIITIEGNTRLHGGDGVFSKRRNPSLVLNLVRIPV